MSLLGEIKELIPQILKSILDFPFVLNGNAFASRALDNAAEKYSQVPLNHLELQGQIIS